jgi:hypothetical protein
MQAGSDYSTLLRAELYHGRSARVEKFTRKKWIEGGEEEPFQQHQMRTATSIKARQLCKHQCPDGRKIEQCDDRAASVRGDSAAVRSY